METKVMNKVELVTTPAISEPPLAPPLSKLAHLTESLKLEHQFLRVPFEHYKKTIRANHRVVEKEVSAVIFGVFDAVDSDGSKDDAVNRLTSLVSRLQGLKRKLEEGSRVENLQAQRCRARLNHLESADVENLADWNNMRLKRILVDYMLRMSYYDTTVKLAESSNIMDLVDIDVFQEAKKVIDALENREVVPTLAWCGDNRSRLKKSKIAPIYLASCIKQGMGLPKILLRKQPVQNNQVLFKIIEICRLYELDSVSSNIMKVSIMMNSASKEKTLGRIS